VISALKIFVLQLTCFFDIFRKGSLIVEYDVIVPTAAVSSVAVANVKIATGQEALQIFNENVTATGLLINNVEGV
jgi:hypothetical protein